MTNQTSQGERLIQCQNCGTQFPAQVHSYIDVTENPQAKQQLLTGQLNVAICPNCGTLNSMAVPLLYHDPTKELLIAHVPMALDMQKDEQERIIGQLMNQLPKDNFKGYMFNPTRAMTQQGLIEQVLEADGVTKEMIDEQKQRVELAQQFVEAGSEENLNQLIQTHDAQIDERFITTLTMMAQRVMESGQQQVAQHILAIQQHVIAQSSYGEELIAKQQAQAAIIEAVSEEIEALDDKAGREDFFQMALRYADDDDRLQALVGLVRPMFDYEFFQLVTTRIGEAPADQREQIETMRDKLLELTAAIDQQQQAAMQQAASFLQTVINHQQAEQLLAANMHLVDDLFMQVLQMNIQEADKRKDIQTAARLKEVQQMVYNLLQSQMTPELRFINDLLDVEDEAEAERMISAQAAEFGIQLLEVIDAVEDILRQQGNQDLLVRLQNYKTLVAKAVSG